MGVFQKVLAKKLPWVEVNNAMFQKAKERMALIHFFKVFKEHPDFKKLDENLQRSMNGPADLVVSLYFCFCFLIIIIN